VPRIEGTKFVIDPGGQVIFRPIVLVAIVLPNGLRGEGPAIIDSGADMTVVPFEAILGAGIDWDKLPPGEMGIGAGGAFERRALQASIFYRTWQICDRVDVAAPGMLGSILLGREDFFKKFVVRFAWHKTPPELFVDPIVLTAKRKR